MNEYILQPAGKFSRPSLGWQVPLWKNAALINDAVTVRLIISMMHIISELSLDSRMFEKFFILNL
jgi:hypothetical protein